MSIVIKTKAHEKLKVGRLCLDIDDFHKLVKVYPGDPRQPPPNRAEMVAIQRYLEVKRPDIVSPGEVMTGWALESAVAI